MAFLTFFADEVWNFFAVGVRKLCVRFISIKILKLRGLCANTVFRRNLIGLF